MAQPTRSQPRLFGRSLKCLEMTSPSEKCAAVEALWALVDQGHFEFDPQTPVSAIGMPGRPAQPQLVEPRKVPRRRLGSDTGRAALIHAIAHIEFNAINLALDAAYRFRDMPRQYYLDWISVAADEARHFRLLSDRLQKMGYRYGYFPAHNGLWEMARSTAGDCLSRMALVPRVLEARGLDVTPGMIERLRAVGDDETVGILGVILSEEVRHVEIGSHWFRHCCDQQGLDPETTFLDLLSAHFGRSVRGPFNVPARIQAGFTQREIEAIEAISSA